MDELSEERERIQQGIQEMRDEGEKKVVWYSRAAKEEEVNDILSKTSEEKYNEVLEEYQRWLSDAKENNDVKAEKEEQERIDNWLAEKESIIDDFEKERQFWSSMSPEERSAEIAKMAEEKFKRVNAFEIVENIEEHSSKNTKRKIKLVKKMLREQVERRDRLKEEMKDVHKGIGILTAGMAPASAALAGIFAAVSGSSPMEVAQVAGGAAAMGTVMAPTMSYSLVGLVRGIGEAQFKTMCMRYPKAVEELKKLGIYEYIVNEFTSRLGIGFHHTVDEYGNVIPKENENEKDGGMAR